MCIVIFVVMLIVCYFLLMMMVWWVWCMEFMIVLMSSGCSICRLMMLVLIFLRVSLLVVVRYMIRLLL